MTDNIDSLFLIKCDAPGCTAFITTYELEGCKEWIHGHIQGIHDPATSSRDVSRAVPSRLTVTMTTRNGHSFTYTEVGL